MKRKILALFFGILWSLLLVPSVFAMDTDVILLSGSTTMRIC